MQVRLSACSLDAAGCEDQGVVCVGGLVDDQIWEILGGSCEGCEFRGCGCGSRGCGLRGGEADEVVGLVCFLGVGLRVEFEGKFGFGGRRGYESLDFGECDFEGGEVGAL